jgi:peptide/nickel transport system permease protein
MTGYIVRRLITAVIVTIGIAAISFLLLHELAASPVNAVLGPKATPQAIRAWNKTHGYDRPFLAQFFSYLNNLLHLNFGYSYKQGQSVGALFDENAGRSAYLSGASLVLALIIAIPLGVAQAVKRNSAGDYAATALTFTLYSMPSFFLGLILIQIFALDLHIFPPLVSDNITTTWGAIIHPAQLFLPILQPLHALLRARQPGAGLHPSGARQGARGAPGPEPPSTAELLPADDHPRRPFDPGTPGRQPAD